MSHVDFNLGVWYPMVDLELLREFQRLAVEQGVKFEFNTEVEKIIVKNGSVTGVKTSKERRLLI